MSRSTVGTLAAPTRRADESLREFSRRRNREKLTAAALQSFAEHGYSGTSIDRIAEIAGTTVPTFYRYFSSKAELLIPLHDLILEEITQVFSRLDSAKPQTLQNVGRWLREYYAMWMRLCSRRGAYWELPYIDPAFGAGVMESALRVIDRAPLFLPQFPPVIRPRIRLRMAHLLILLDKTMHLATDSLGGDNSLDEEYSQDLINDFAAIIWLTIYSSEAQGGQFGYRVPRESRSTPKKKR
jgi:AcrR family transcriptional regulator